MTNWRPPFGGTPVLIYRFVDFDALSLGLETTVDSAGTRALPAGGLTTTNRSEVGRALNTIFSGDGSGLTTLGDRLSALPSAGALAATLDALSGEAVADVQQAVFTGQQLYTATLMRHATEAGPGGLSPSGAGRSIAPAASPIDDQGVRVWIGGSDRLDGIDGRSTLHTQIAGGLIGLDK